MQWAIVIAAFLAASGDLTSGQSSQSPQVTSEPKVLKVFKRPAP